MIKSPPEINYEKLTDSQKNESSVPSSAGIRQITKTIQSNTSSQKKLKNIFYMQTHNENEENLEKNKFVYLEDWNEIIEKIETIPKF